MTQKVLNSIKGKTIEALTPHYTRLVRQVTESGLTQKEYQDLFLELLSQTIKIGDNHGN